MLHDKLLMKYIEEHSSAEDPVLVELTRQTHLEVVQPRMLTGHVQGLFLRLMAAMIAPEKVLEIGTFTGYSAICLAGGMPENGILHTIDPNDEIGGIARVHFEKAGLTNCIVQHTGTAQEIIPLLNETFDLVYIDGDKREYIDYYDLLMDGGYVRSGSFLFADNVLWDGKVVETEGVNPTSGKDSYTPAIKAFNAKVKNDPRVETVILPLRDGMSVIRVK